MYSVLVIVAVILAVLLILIVLIQESKGGGLASNFAASNQIMGVRKTTDVIEKATWSLAAALVVVAVATIYFAPRANTSAVDTIVAGAVPATTTTTPTASTTTPAASGASQTASEAAPAK